MLPGAEHEHGRLSVVTKNLVTLKLSNPLDAAQAQRVRAAEVKDYRPGDTIKVPQQEAFAVIAAGYALKVDPADHEAVASALNIPVEQVRATSEAHQAARAASSGKT
uniref:hypothetical protein n=1 Tax=Nonomuraea sp. CA-251285 TaxID=3240002 RepID=UPI003F495F17